MCKFLNKPLNVYLFIVAFFLIIGLPYIIKFGFGFWDTQSEWGVMATYFGGMLSPVLAFFTIIILIQTNGKNQRAHRSVLRQNARHHQQVVSQVEQQLFNSLFAQLASDLEKSVEKKLESDSSYFTKITDELCNIPFTGTESEIDEFYSKQASKIIKSEKYQGIFEKESELLALLFEEVIELAKKSGHFQEITGKYFYRLRGYLTKEQSFWINVYAEQYCENYKSLKRYQWEDMRYFPSFENPRKLKDKINDIKDVISNNQNK
ncbi:hypothetical protein B0W48_04230 [Pseudoalteromonas aliena]|uniref:Uncharacterized protein n=1 Tax=Pseudoalteromonas aliena TaxID=247523 RepID=A0A1Q2GVR0_9GAMM|nr:hypothetical protein [Pseudoalteromonas aliena]AQP99080.1 hypothetical protein B0W48_04230 [Pseudoalteromonas aliena]